MKVNQVNNTGQDTKQIEIDNTIFAGKRNDALVAQYVHVHRQRRALGTKKTKGRGEVAGGGKKPWRQKGTGRARHGSIRSPIWVGGGHAHAIRPRNNARVRISKKMRGAALASVLTTYQKQEQLLFVDQLELAVPRTKAVVEFLERLGIAGNKVLIVTPAKNGVIEKSTANLPQVNTMEARLLNPVAVLNHNRIVFLGEAPEVLAKLHTNTKQK